MTDEKTWEPWTDAQHHKLMALVESGDSWDRIANDLGHSVGGCMQRYRKHASPDRRRDVAKMRRKNSLQAAKTRKLAPKRSAAQAPAGAVSWHRISTAALIADAELRARISVCGLTAGLCGDPPPGRSALDKINAGIADDDLPIDYHTSWEARIANRPKITLPTEPLR